MDGWTVFYILIALWAVSRLFPPSIDRIVTAIRKELGDTKIKVACNGKPCVTCNCRPTVKCNCKAQVTKSLRVGREVWKPGQSVKLKAGVGPTMQLGRLFEDGDNDMAEVLVALGDVVLTQTLPVAALRRLDDLEELTAHVTENVDGGRSSSEEAGRSQQGD